MKRTIKYLIALTVLLVLSWNTACLASTPQIKVKLILVTVNGDTTVVAPGESASSALNVPLKAKFVSELQSDDGNQYILFPEWTVTRSYIDGEQTVTEDYLKRQESETEYEFKDYGSFQVSFAWSYREKTATETIPGEDVQTMSFTIDDSEIRLFNAFSPNGDGINDEYKIYARSIVSMKIAIFNRWGQTLKTISGPMEEILPFDAEPDNEGGFLFVIWDGTYGGEVVKDGVYFINVQAVGAGGKKYDEKSDINVLKGLGLQN